MYCYTNTIIITISVVTIYSSPIEGANNIEIHSKRLYFNIDSIIEY